MGVDVGARWGAIADLYETQARGQYAFDDAHAMLAFTAACRRDQADALIAAHAEELGATVHSTDHDFNRFATLKWQNPLET